MPATGRLERTKAANRGAILAAGRDAFAAHGYDAVGVRDIVRRTKLAWAMLAVGLELGQELAERDPPDVEGATRFATALFSGGLDVMARRYAAPSCAPASPSS